MDLQKLVGWFHLWCVCFVLCLYIVHMPLYVQYAPVWTKKGGVMVITKIKAGFFSCFRPGENWLVGDIGVPPRKKNRPLDQQLKFHNAGSFKTNDNETTSEGPYIYFEF